MKIANNIFIVVTILGIMGCSQKEQPHTQCIENNITINIDSATYLNPKQTLYEVCTIPLQTSEICLIGEISKLYTTSDYIIVVDQKYNNILQFDIKGEFIQKIGVKGQGPNEYIMFNDVVYDYNTQKIFAFERYRKAMYVYDLNGRLLSTINSKFSFNSFLKCESGFWIYSCFKDNNPHNSLLMLVDENLSTIIEEYFPQKEINTVQFTHRFTINPINGKQYFYFDGSDIIWQLTDKATEAFKVDFGELVLPYSEIKKAKGIEEYNKIVHRNSYLGFIENLFISNDWLFFTCRKSGLNKSNTLFNIEYEINKEATTIYRGTLNTKGTIPADYTNLLCITPEDILVYPIDPQKMFPHDFENLKKHIKNISEDDNPILLFVKKYNY